MAKANQTISFPSLSDKNVSDAAFAISASGGASGNSILFSIVSGPATISGNTITLTGATGTVTVAANQLGNVNYNAASQVVQIFNVTGTVIQDQSITFGNIGDKLTTNSPFGISASASSGLTVSFSVLSGPATISGSTVSLTGGTGTVTIAANQSGNGSYNPANQVTQSFTVSYPPLTEQTITLNAIPNKLSTDIPFSISAYATSGLSVVLSVISGPATISGSTITLTGSTGTVIIAANQSGNTSYTFSLGENVS